MESKPSNYQVIARKYRPQTFASVIGQEAIVTTLKNALRFNRLAHAYLFCGCRGTGKTTLARVFAKALNCSRPTADLEPCDACPSCLDIIAGRSLDVLEIDGASNRGIDDIRQINETIGYAPASGKYKIYIIDEVHMLTKEAFNALLKTLEEPPLNVKFFFATTEPHKVLPTIISRCQRFDLNRIPLDALKKKLAWIAEDLGVPCEEEVFSMIASLAEGSLRDAESLLDQIICYAEHPITAAKVSATLGMMPRSSFFSLDGAFASQDLSFAFELASDIFSSGKDLSYFLDNLVEHYRTLLKLKLGASAALTSARLKEQYAASAALYTEEQCLYILDFLLHWQQQIGKTPFKRVSLEMILLHIVRSKQRLTLPALVRRLQELEQKLAAEPRDSALPEVKKVEPAPLAVAEKPKEAPPLPAAEEPKEHAPIAPLILSDLPPETPAAPPLLAAEAAKEESLSLEETLMNKIRLKIEATPLPAQEPTIDEAPAKSPSILLSKAKWEAMASSNQQIPSPSPDGSETAVKPVEAAPKAAETPPSPANQSRYDTLIRFAAVELEGTLKKEHSHG